MGWIFHRASRVVICLKFTTFVVAATVLAIGDISSLRCDLLKIYYLCGSSNSRVAIVMTTHLVVICLKFTTFVVAATVNHVTMISGSLL